MEILKYTNESGKCPFDEWMNKVDKSVAARVAAKLFRIKDQGNFGQMRNLGDGVSRLKFTFGGGIRIYYGVHQGKMVVLLSGGDKKSQSKDIEKAKQYWKDFQKQAE